MPSLPIRKTTRILTIAAALAATAFGAAAVNADRSLAPNMPSQKAGSKMAAVDAQAEKVLDRFVQALGGEAAVRSIHSYSMTGTMEIPAQGMSGTAEAYAKAPNKFLLIEDIAGVGKARQGFDGAVGWSEDPVNGSRQLAGVELAQFRRTADFYQSVDFKKLYASIKFKGDDKVDGKDVHVLDAAPPEGGLERLYFDVQTGLLVRSDQTINSPQGQFPVQSYAEDYQSVGRTKMPFVLRQVLPIFTLVIKWNAVKPNIPVEDSIFAKP